MGHPCALAASDGPSATALSSFLNDPDCATLELSSGGPTSALTARCAPTAAPATATTAAILFSKLRPCILDEETLLTDLAVSSLPAPANLSLLRSMHDAILPRLLQSVPASGRDRTALTDMNASVVGLLRAARGASNGGDALPPVTPAGELVARELAHWNAAAGQPGKGRECAYAIAQGLEPLASVDAALTAAATMDEVAELGEDAVNVCDALWRLPLPPSDAYPAPRMAALLEALGSRVADRVSALVAAGSWWGGPPADLRMALRDGEAACSGWTGGVRQLTERAWASLAVRPWPTTPTTAAPALAAPTVRLAARLHAVAETAALLEEVCALLPESVRRKARLQSAIEAVRGVGAEEALATSGGDASGGPTHNSPRTTKTTTAASSHVAPALTSHGGKDSAATWVAASSALEAALVVSEGMLAAALRTRIAQLSRQSSPEAILREATRFSGLLCRQGVAKQLESEREAVLAVRSNELDGARSELWRMEEALAAAPAKRAVAVPTTTTATTTSTSSSSSSSSRRQLAQSPLSASTSTRAPSATASPAPTRPSILHVLQWAHALRARLAALLPSTAGLCGDLGGFPAWAEGARELSARLTTLQEDELAAWGDATERALRSGSRLALQTTGRLMEFDAGGNMVVRFSEELITLLRETRQLQEGGFVVPRRIVDAAGEAEQFYRLGVQLQRVASFYNAMGAEIVPVLKPLLLEPLLAFERLVQQSVSVAAPSEQGGGGGGGGHGAVTWANTKACADFVDALQLAADKVAGSNRALRSLHGRAVDNICALMSIDPLRAKEAWRAKWAAIADRVAAASASRSRAALLPWLRHLDFQLYKAVEAGYRVGLEALNEAAPEVRAELVVVGAGAGGRSSGGTLLAFRPPLEELRAAYYRELKKFVGLPTAFGGLTGDARVFAVMLPRNGASLTQVYRKAEVLFARLGQLRDRLRPWVAMGGVDPDALVAAHVHTTADFAASLDSLKARRREAELLPECAKVDCVTVGLGGLKAAVDAQLGRGIDALLLGLFASLGTASGEVTAFLERGSDAMAARPTSLAGIAASQREWRALCDARGDMRTTLATCEERARLLRSQPGGAGLLDGGSDTGALLAALPARWASFEAALDGYSELVEGQRRELRGNVAGEVRDVQARVDKLAAKWAAAQSSLAMEITPATSSSTTTTIGGATASAGWGAADASTVFTLLGEWQTAMGALGAAVTAVSDSCDGFGLPRPAFEGLARLEAAVADKAAMWEAYRAYDAAKGALAGVEWVAFRPRIHELTEFAATWGDAAAGRARDAVGIRISSEVDALRRALPALKLARGEAFKEEHWTALFKKVGLPKGVRLDSPLTVGHLLGALPALAAATPWLKELAARAQGEVTIREALAELKAWSETAEFALTEHVSLVSGRRTPLIRDWKQLFVEVGDNQALLGSLKESPYFRPFADTAAVFEAHLATLDACAQSLSAIQRRWVYLEPVFGRGALPSEAARFARTEEEYRALMLGVGRDPRVFSLVEGGASAGLVDALATMLEQLERCQRALADFLEERRSAFPRFYFIGDDDLLEILGQATDPAVVQAHLKKLFQGVARVEFGGGGGGGSGASLITALCSSTGEVVRLRTPVAVTDDVTAWLSRFAAEMGATLAAQLEACVRGRATTPWTTALATYPSQVHSVGEQVAFAADVEAALAPGGPGLLPLRAALAASLAAYTGVDTGAASCTPVVAAALKALIMDAIHHLEVVDGLLERAVKDAGSWHWQRQLRFYLDGATGRVYAHMVNSQLEYTYEYQGNAPRLVHTPLTDKCYLVLTQGVAAGYGGNPYGPAGTGKTESVKALGAALGRQVLVFNCDEGLDFTSMGRIFTGIVKCGAWGCFDEFNRLREDQLSAVSQQIQVIQAAIKARAPTATLLGRDIDVNPAAGIFVTLNPAGKGYGGRSRLPDNLKQLFRPVAMSAPDNELIAEVILHAEGFTSARELGRKVVALYRLGAQLLSAQQHYDWGLRAIKTTLNTGGGLIGAWKKARQGGGGGGARESEATLLVKAVRVNTLSKLTAGDALRFAGLVADVFPGVPVADVEQPRLEAAVREVAAAKPFSLTPDTAQTAKILQLKEALDQRIGCVVVGPSGAGKSTLWRVLGAALARCGQHIVTHVMNPKSMPRARLLGALDPDTREWTDGVLTAAARAAAREPPAVRTWIVCDGDVDPEWIESLNSVLGEWGRGKYCVGVRRRRRSCVDEDEMAPIHSLH